METVHCPICGERHFEPLLEAPDRFRPSALPWTLVQSRNCGLVMLNPRPDADEAPEHYPADRYDPFIHHGNCRSWRDRAYLAASDRFMDLKASLVMNGLKNRAKTASVLEVGCSTGRLLSRIHRTYGMPARNLWGIEASHEAAEAARRSGNCRIVESDLCDARLDGRFDRIVFWHVLEHIHRINETLDRSVSLLAPGGMLVIALPNLSSGDALRYGRNWVALDAPRHLYHFSPGTLAALLEKHGLRIIDMNGFLPDAAYNAWYSEKLARTSAGKGFGAAGAAMAIVRGVRSMAEALSPANASTIVYRAVKAHQPLATGGGAVRPSALSSSTAATR